LSAVSRIEHFDCILEIGGGLCVDSSVNDESPLDVDVSPELGFLSILESAGMSIFVISL